MEEVLKFIADNNVGKLAKWLRMVGFDTESFNGTDDGEMVAIAVAENRIILTRDTGVMARRLITSGQVRAILIESDRLVRQIRQVSEELHIDKSQYKPLTFCLECNRTLMPRTKSEVKNRVPSHVFETQEQFVECPSCNRIYWRGTHWQAMQRKIENVIE
ncbi:MAG: Mut7-C RNAse domain-containing protein [Dehalococcoidales bacterium]|nr:Mut7-C RNAse domain-containing protein [Dehalococcoidales bacterium]